MKRLARSDPPPKMRFLKGARSNASTKIGQDFFLDRSLTTPGTVPIPDILHAPPARRLARKETIVTLYTSLFAMPRVCLSATSFSAITSSGSVSVRALVPTSSRFRTLTERLSSSSWPTTA